MEGKTSKTSAINEQRRNFLSGSISAGFLGAGIAAGLVPALAQAESGKQVNRMASYTVSAHKSAPTPQLGNCTH